MKKQQFRMAVLTNKTLKNGGKEGTEGVNFFVFDKA